METDISKNKINNLSKIDLNKIILVPVILIIFLFILNYLVLISYGYFALGGKGNSVVIFVPLLVISAFLIIFIPTYCASKLFLLSNKDIKKELIIENKKKFFVTKIILVIPLLLILAFLIFITIFIKPFFG